MNYRTVEPEIDSHSAASVGYFFLAIYRDIKCFFYIYLGGESEPAHADDPPGVQDGGGALLSLQQNITQPRESQQQDTQH
jgi:hypothetical protein